MAKIAIVVPAAGFGTRMGSAVAKQFIEVDGKTILARTIDRLGQWADTYDHDASIIVALSEYVELPSDIKNVHTCVGGQTRADSVAQALTAIKGLGYFDWAMVHDAARPLVNVAVIEKLFQTVKNDAVGGILAEKITSTVKQVVAGEITKTVPRDQLWLAQTPQLFRFDLLEQSFAGDRTYFTDEASSIEALGYAPKVVEGNRENIKITTPDDLEYLMKQFT